MALAMVLPLTFGMGNEPAIAVMLSTYIGGMTGGAISAILIGVPGTPSAAATVFDGHLLAKSNQASLAIGTATVAAGVGGIFSLIVMLIAVKLLANVALAFGPAEITALVIFGLSTICGLAEKSLVRGMIGGVLGLMVMAIGQDPLDGMPRFTFGNTTMLQGVDLLVAMIGLFAVPHAVAALIAWKSGREAKVEARAVEVKLPSIRLLLSHWWNLLRSSLIGTVIGAIPGTGGPIAAFLAYDQAKRFHKHPERMGKGEGDLAGVIAPEAANHAVTGGAMIPLLGLGIPGDPATAIILGGLLIHGIQPGPLLFAEKPAVVANIYILFLFAYVVVVLLQLYGVRLFVQCVAGAAASARGRHFGDVRGRLLRHPQHAVRRRRDDGDRLGRLFPAARAHSGGAGVARPGAGADARARIAHGADHVGRSFVDFLVVAAGADIFCPRHPGDRRPSGRHVARQGPGAGT